MPEPRTPESAPGSGRAKVLWTGAALLAVAASGVLVLSDDSRLLKLGLVAALWAALLGAFAAARLRGRIAEDDERAAEMQRIYELELEREVSARQEFEVEAENEARRRIAEESANEIQALKAELRTLRESLEQVLGGDVLFERVALRAESTRVRSLAENGGQGHDSRVIQHRDDWARELPAGQSSNAHASSSRDGEANTQMISRLSGETHADQRKTAPPARPQQPPRPPQRPQTRSVQGHVEPPESGRPGTLRRAPEQRRAPQNERPAERSRSQMPAPEPVAAKPQYTSASATTANSSSRQVGRIEQGSQHGNQTPQAQRTPASAKSVSQAAAGAHTEGTSVSELLAAYGNAGESQRRRRRRE